MDATTPEVLLAAAITRLHSDRFSGDLGRWLESEVRHDNITTLAYYQNRAPTLLWAHARQPLVHQNVDEVYLKGAYLLDPFHDLHNRRVPAGLYRLDDIAPDQFHRNRYFLDYYRRTTMVDEVAFVSYPSGGVSLHLCLGRDGSSNQRFSARDIRAARRIAPLVVALAQAHWQNLTSEGENGGEGDGESLISKLINALKTGHGIALSPRQAEVAVLVLRGHSSVSIGLKLGISPLTVKVFRKQLYKRCSISSQAELFQLMLPLLGQRVDLGQT
jgi:DNA-binding CsgD family transcriptional regulator